MWVARGHRTPSHGGTQPPRNAPGCPWSPSQGGGAGLNKNMSWQSWWQAIHSTPGALGCCDRESKRSPTFSLLVHCLPLPPLLARLAGQEAPESGENQDESHHGRDPKDQEGAGQVHRGEGGLLGRSGGRTGGLCCGVRCRWCQEGKGWGGGRRTAALLTHLSSLGTAVVEKKSDPSQLPTHCLQ